MKRVYYLVFFSGIFLLLLPYCYTDKKAWHKGNIMPEGFAKLTRQDQVLYCAKCHQQEYDNEMKGPHANAYQRFQQHVAFVNSDKYDCAWYTASVNKKKGECVSCHTPQDLFQTVFEKRVDNMDPMASLRANIKPFPPPRVAESSRSTSVDCISCHYDGQSILATNSKPHQLFNAPECNPKDNPIMSSNMTCYPCHWDAVNTLLPDAARLTVKDAKCTSCHMEHDAKGNVTHYTFWKHDSPDKHNVLIERIVDDFSVNINKDGLAEITWLNTAVPHELAPGPEMIFKCQLLSQDSNVIGTKVVRMNLKKKIDTEMAEVFGTKILGGVDGDPPKLDHTPLKYTFDVKNTADAKMMRITLIKKAQHWFPDSLGIYKTERVIGLQRPL
ncbi:MAG: hypothetical protein JWO06_2383 [Bacteroidota bacterium]|nr:hypothetical protein [Bacteroidota bacterium]